MLLLLLLLLLLLREHCFLPSCAAPSYLPRSPLVSRSDMLVECLLITSASLLFLAHNAHSYPLSLPSVGSRSGHVPGPYPLHYTGVPIIDSRIACEQLTTVVPQLLADLAVPLHVDNVISLLVLEGENPSTSRLYNAIPRDVLQPPENIAAAIKSVGEWTPEDVKADGGYGEADNTQIRSGGLPTFCRFGANVITSDTSNVWFETWMPLPSNISSSPWSSSHSPSFMLGNSSYTDQSSGTVSVEGSAVQEGAASRDGWRGRLIFSGNSGQSGSVNYPEMKQTLTRYREAASSCNGGHFGSSSLSNWTIGNVERQIDFGYRGVHIASRASQTVVEHFYGVSKRLRGNQKGSERRKERDSERVGFPTYFKGCSTGGRQGFSEAQRFPHDYDGIMAGSPAIYYNSLNAYQIHVNALQSNDSSPRYIPRSLYPVIHKHILSECDQDDGIKDGVLENPMACEPDLQKLLCHKDQITAQEKASETPKCLTQDQLDNLRAIYTALRYPDGSIIHEPVTYGSESSWTVTNGVVGTPFPPASGWFQYQVLNETGGADSFLANETVEGNFTLIQLGQNFNPGGTNTDNADLTDYFARGSKILHYHGTADQLIPSGSSDRYFKEVHKHTRANYKLSKSYRYFHIPGMAHCRDGSGAWNFGGASQTAATGSRPWKYDVEHDALVALFDWVESSKPPDYFVGAAYKNFTDQTPNFIGNTSLLRPYGKGLFFTHKMCPYPQQAVVVDSSNPYRASSQHCRQQ